MTGRLTALLLATALVTTACFDTGDDDSSDDGGDAAAVEVTTTTELVGGEASAAATTEPAATSAPDTTAAPATTAAPETTTATPETTTAPDTTDPPATTPAGDCLVGNWVITQDEMNGFYDAVEANIDEPFSIDIVGEVLLNMTETDYEYLPSFDLAIVVAGLEASGVASGSVSGTYVADDGIIVTTLGAADMSVVVNVGGTTMDASDMGNDFLTTVPINDAPYSCAAGVPVIDFETGDGTPRHPVTLAPA